MFRRARINSGPVVTTIVQIGRAAESSGFEGDTGSSLRIVEVKRTGDLSGASTVDWRTQPASFAPAADGADFLGGVFPSGQLTFAPGEAVKTITFSVVGDTVPEGAEGYEVVLSQPVGAELGISRVFASIDNDDGLPPRFSIQSAQQPITEADSGVTPYAFLVTRTGGLSGPASVTYAVTGDGMEPADGTDFAGGVLPAGRVDFADGETSKEIVINVAGDRTIEGSEGFTVTISPVVTTTSSPLIHQGSASGLIVSNDFRPMLHLSSDTLWTWEGNDGFAPITFNIQRSGLQDAATVDWAVSGSSVQGPPASGDDFQGGQFPSGVVSFAAGQRDAQIVIYVRGDRQAETSEGFTLTISNPSDNAFMRGGSLRGTILNDDQPPTVAITANQAVEVTEGQSGVTPLQFTLNRTGDIAQASSVDWSVSWFTGTVKPDDFEPGTPTSGRVDFAVGESVKVITLGVRADTIGEADEILDLELSNPSGFSMIANRFVRTVITNDDAPVPGSSGGTGGTAGSGNGLMSDTPGPDSLFGGVGADTISGANGGFNYLRGDAGDDSIVGGADFDDINGNMGDDIAAGGDGDDWVVGGKDQDLLFGDRGDDIVYGNMGDDTCYGGEGNDLLRGGQHNDLLLGDAGDDWLSGDRGDDTITGGAGADTFHSFGDAGIDWITDFRRAEGDRIQIDLDPGGSYTVSQSGANTIIAISGGAQMVLVGVMPSSLVGDWIALI